ncbi:probable serine/threonine-protein kinase roco5 isoform X2 [Quercus lobata]|uniref:probable serine/threonine-protein kinase roco5 isoform X2 n=1 Tax=Quercus lobata TaxID=97700 RepID=UPI001245703B|nr:probable serine/threonine-protein kinase roco5 isoform X2 [Quercus lobata]
MASTSTSSSSSQSSSILDDPSNPLYLHHEESPGAMLVYQPLVGENYPTWARSMRMALIAKNKLGFIDGTLTLSSPMVKTPSTIQAWIRCNKMVASWILNSVSQEIATSIIYRDTALEIWNNLKERLSQGNGPRIFQLRKDIVGSIQGQSSITSYFTQLKVLWDQLQHVRPFPVCSCGSCTCNLGQKVSDLQHQDLVVRFLMGLNDSYSQVRAQILLMDPLPSINEVYSLLIQEERECSVKKNLDPHMESTTLVTKVSSSAGNNNNKNSEGKNDSTCNHCGMMGHTVEKCYKSEGKKSTVVHQVNLQDEQVEKNSTSASTSFSFTKEQCQQSLATPGTQIQSVNFDFASKEHMDNNVIQPATHSTFMAEFVANNSSDPGSWVRNGTTNPIPNFSKQLSIASLFPAYNSDTETDASSESNEIPPKLSLYSNSIMSFFPPARSQSDSSNSESPIHPIRKVTFKDLFEFRKWKSSNSAESNGTPPKFSHSKKKSILSFFSTAKSRTNNSKNDETIQIIPRRTLLTPSFKDLIGIVGKKEYPLQMLLEATNNFSEYHKIGTGSFGSIYRATLNDGRVVVIKRAEISKSKPYESYVNDCEYHGNAFLSELEALSRLSHKNLVRLLGFCEDDNEHVLVFDYMRNGSLHDHLHKLPSTPLMSWVTRIKVALDIARGIEYLHVYAVPPIIHRDIKSSNILLDATWTAKVTDFGLSLKAPMDAESPLSLLAAGTVGYMDPEYYRLQQLTTKSDVYGFGVVLLEMLSGYNAIHADENGVPRNVVDFVAPYIIQDEIQKVLDPKVPPPTPFEIEAVAYVGYLAVDCVSPEGLNRPSMTEIVKSLQRALDACLDPDAE